MYFSTNYTFVLSTETDIIYKQGIIVVYLDMLCEIVDIT